MSISLGALEAALSEITNLGHEEITFPVWGTNLTMRTLCPEEEHKVQGFANQAWTEDSDNDSGEALAFVDKFRLETIARAVVQINDQDLRGVQYIDTGGSLPNGKPVKEPVHLVLRKLVGKWGGPIRTQVFKKYTEMLKKVEVRSEAAIVFEPSDIETEVDRLKERLAGLESELEAAEGSGRVNPAHSIAAYGDKERAMVQDASDNILKPSEDEDASKVNPEVFGPTRTALAQEPVEAPIPQRPPGPRQPILPTRGAPPVQTQPQPQRQPQAEPEGSGAAAWEDGGSFVDTTDMGQMVARENQRLAHARATGQPLHEPIDSALMAVQDGHRPMPPHMAAQEVQTSAFKGTTPDGVPVYSMDGGTLTENPRGSGQRAPAKAAPSSLNPRFKRS